jgi:hypothetical protein
MANKTMSCSICNQPIKTARGALQMRNTPWYAVAASVNNRMAAVRNVG